MAHVESRTVRRVGLAALIAAVAILVMFYLSFRVVPDYARRVLAEGREIGFPEQLFIASGHFWRRHGLVVTAATAIVLGVTAVLRGMRPDRAP